MASVEACGICLRPQRKQPLVTCITCGQAVHISCTISKRPDRPKCTACAPKKRAALGCEIEKGKGISNLKAAAALKNAATTSRSASTPRGSPLLASLSLLPTAANLSHRLLSSAEKADSVMSLGTTGDADSTLVLARRSAGTQAHSSSSSESKINLSTLNNSSSNDSHFKLLNTSSVANRTMVSNMVEYANNTQIGIGKMFDDLLSSVNGKTDNIIKSLAVLPAMNMLIGDLSVRLSSMEEQVQVQNSKLEELLSRNESLTSVNCSLVNKIEVLEAKISTMLDAMSPPSPICKVGDSDSSVAVTQRQLGGGVCNPLPQSRLPCAPRSSDGGVAAGATVLDSEVIVAGAVRDQTPQSICDDVAFAVLNSLLPSFRREDIVDVRALRPSGSGVRMASSDEDGDGSGSGDREHHALSL